MTNNTTGNTLYQQYVNSIIGSYSASTPTNSQIASIGNALALPIIRSIAASTVGFDLVKVQPLSLPTGQLFYMDPVFMSKHQIERKRAKERIEKLKKLPDVSIYIKEGANTNDI